MVDIYMKHFVRAGHNLLCQQELKSPQQHQNNVNGDHIKEFYEEVMKLPSQNTSKKSISKPEKPKIRQKVPKIEFSVTSFHKAAQDGDVETLKKCINQGCDVNIKDMYGWTALMCAVAAGSRKSVEFLLQNGADLNVKDNSGKTVWNIAEKSRFRDITTVLRPERRLKFHFFDEKSHQKREKSFYCQHCKQHFDVSVKSDHLTSTIHQLSSKTPKTMTSYHIPDDNVGFQLLLKEGWDRERGLGPTGNGMKYPVKTILKRDRKGLGLKTNQKAKITHFESRDQRAVKEVKVIKETRSVRKKREQRREMREKLREMKFRRMLNE